MTKQRYVLGLDAIDRTQVAIVGGKGAHLGALARIEGVRVPTGFCTTTHAFRRFMASDPAIDERIERLARLRPDDREAIRALSADIRGVIEAIPIPADVLSAITDMLGELDEASAYAVRSSATAEDLPTTSFAGQHDTFLNVVGRAAIVEHVRRCWASLFTERAVVYRQRNGFDHRRVHMAVVVQQMLSPEAAGVLFTADPISGNRKVASIEACFGLGEALVSGLVKADGYRAREDAILTKTIANEQPVLTDAQVVRLAELGRQIEAHFGAPQDIEWCLVGGHFHIVQSRPITTLFPIPQAADGASRVYLSVGHQQMMTDAMKPLGLSLFLLTTLAPMHEAGGRLFVDVTERLASPTSRAALLELSRKSDPLVADALETVLERGFVPLVAAPTATNTSGAPQAVATDPALVTELIERTRASLAALERDIRGVTGAALFDFILADLKELQRLLFDPQSHRALMAAFEGTWWLNEKLHAWLGEKNAADILTQSAPGNVTSQMGLALLGVADVIRPYPDVVAFLKAVDDEQFLDELPSLGGGREARDAIRAYLDQYGMRCPGEIDITRPRWSERPTMLLPALLANIEGFAAGAGTRRFEQGRWEAWNKEQEILVRLRALPDGEQKAAETKQVIDRVRTFIGYREYPKYGKVCRYFVYKQALMAEAERLVNDGVLHEEEDIFYLTFHELHEAVRAKKVDEALVRQRKDAFASFRSLTPPRVLTSEGEAVVGTYRRTDWPAGAMVGLAVSAGTVEGRARVVLEMAEAKLEAGDILVTTFTDPGWTPLFVAVKGLVTEVGGLMSHGAVIAREYGLPAVVGVQNATRRIRDGQRIRVHGTNGYVEVLDP